MANLSYGSYGENVKKLQTALNNAGYDLEVDGGFGAKTKAAVVDYQTKNSLRVDGVVGNETWGSLANNRQAAVAAPAPQTSAGVLSGVSQETADALARLEQGAVPSAETETARAALDSVSAAQPRDFVSDESGELRRLYEKIAGRKAFSYDPGKDALFGQYADEYVRQGKQAMADTVGKAASLTGGYASSYGQTAGQEAYQTYLQQLYDLIPKLSEQAQSRYDSEGKSLYDRYQLLQDEDKAAYDRWRDTVSDWKSQHDAAYKDYDSARAQDAEGYKLLLNYYADKASAEQKAAPEGRVNNSGKAAGSGEKTLSSVAYGSLSGAMGNYLKNGGYDSAAALWQQYQGRMTAQQRQMAAALFQKYGYQV